MATPRLAEPGSRRLSNSPSFLLNIQKPTLQLGNSLTHRVGESFFYYEYLPQFEAKSGPKPAKTPENPLYCHVPLNILKII
jgi:hypothetical protein